jgi:glyoxylase-like metal-dependent hydrolase (beta-lactamase superfamily II)
MQIAPRIHRVGADSRVNSYLVEEGTEVTIIDAAAPGLWGLVPAELAAMGRSLEDVRAIVLTHGHSDHVGYAERARRERGWRVLVHERTRRWHASRSPTRRRPAGRGWGLSSRSCGGGRATGCCGSRP